MPPYPMDREAAVRVMLIEDDDELAKVIEKGLSEKGMRITHVGDARGGLQRLVFGETVHAAGYRFAS